MARLIKIGYEHEVAEGQHVMKEAYDRALVLTCSNDQFECYEIPDTSSYGSSDSMTNVAALPGSKQLAVIQDVDDEGRHALWIKMMETNTPMKAAPPAKPSAPQAGYSTIAPADTAAFGGEAPSPLIPFAGLDRKAMPPSPAKPFSPQASPMKPSPLKERIDTATQAVAQKHWTQKQSKMNGLFGSNAAKPPQPAPQQHGALTHAQVHPLRAVIFNPDAMDD